MDSLVAQNEKELSRQLLLVYTEAHALLEKTVGLEPVRKELEYYLHNKPSSIEAVYERMLESLRNKQGYANFITTTGEVGAVLGTYDPRVINREYAGDIKRLYEHFQKKFGGKYKFDFNNKRNAWLIYTKGVLSSAQFLATFKNYKAFDDFVQSFFLNEYTVAALPMLLEAEIFGFGFPLACDLLKEIGYTKYGKPDVHLKDIFLGLKLVPNESDYETFKAIVRTAYLADTEPVCVDIVYWIIGSGKFENSSGEKIGSLKKQFIQDTLPKLGLS